MRPAVCVPPQHLQRTHPTPFPACNWPPVMHRRFSRTDQPFFGSPLFLSLMRGAHTSAGRLERCPVRSRYAKLVANAGALLRSSFHTRACLAHPPRGTKEFMFNAPPGAAQLPAAWGGRKSRCISLKKGKGAARVCVCTIDPTHRLGKREQINAAGGVRMKSVAQSRANTRTHA